MSYLDDFFDKRKAQRQPTPEQKANVVQKDLEAQRQKAINFKKYFGSDDGREVMLDIMNKYYVLSPLPRLADGHVDEVAEGQREVVLYILNRANVTMEDLDRILKGDFS